MKKHFLVNHPSHAERTHPPALGWPSADSDAIIPRWLAKLNVALKQGIWMRAWGNIVNKSISDEDMAALLFRESFLLHCCWENVIDSMRILSSTWWIVCKHSPSARNNCTADCPQPLIFLQSSKSSSSCTLIQQKRWHILGFLHGIKDIIFFAWA